jgi:uncharacterized protein YydD (DUF2326 family)
MIQVKTEVEGIVRDVTNGALLNKDNAGLEAYRKAKKKTHEMDSRVNRIESDISEIKNLLLKLIEKSQ